MNRLQIGPILRSMLRNKTRVLLLGVEIAVTIAVVLNCSAMILAQLEVLQKPTGIAEDELIAVSLQPWSADYREFSFRQDVIRRDAAALRALPGVVDATPISTFPLQGGGSSMMVRPLGAPEEDNLRTPVYSADHHVLETLDLELVAGRAFEESDLRTSTEARIMNILVTQDLADALFPDGNAVGQTVDTGSAEYPDVIIGIVDHMFTPYGGGPMETRITFYPGLPGGSQRMSYLVRAEPGSFDQVFAQIDETLKGVQADRVATVRPLEDIKAGGYLQNVLMANVFGGIVVLLLFVTSLGIFGITAYSVTQRTKQIGTRRALGATRAAVLRHFLLESAVITLFGLGLGLIGAYALNVLMVSQAGAPRLGLELVTLGSVVLVGLCLLATWVPARRAAALPPAFATRTV